MGAVSVYGFSGGYAFARWLCNEYVCTKSTNEGEKELREREGDADSINYITLTV
jgi:hypothetical protein